jgi:hypothetical protein
MSDSSRQFATHLPDLVVQMLISRLGALHLGLPSRQRITLRAQLFALGRHEFESGVGALLAEGMAQRRSGEEALQRGSVRQWP